MGTAIKKIKKVGRFILDTHLWKPSHARVVFDDYFHRVQPLAHSNDEHMLSALDWLKRAQDATGNGGVAGRYQMNLGFTNSYPETSGHILSTLIKSGYYFNDQKYKDYSEKIVGFLLDVQMEDGEFQRGEYIKGAKRIPAVFNTGQIMLGLIAWYNETGDDTVLQALIKSADWLLDIQEPEGYWQKHTYGLVQPTNYTRVAWPLALLGDICSEKKYKESALRYLEWLLTKTDDETGWIDNMGFYKEDHETRRSLTHTMAYAYRGLLECALLFDRADMIEIVKKASSQIIEKYMSSAFLSGVYNFEWKGLENYSCLTGNCQLSIIWLKLFKYFNDESFLNAAIKAMEQVKSYQRLDFSNSGIKGAIAGSRPVWGGYITKAYPNWAAKFFIDALLLIEQIDADSNSSKTDHNFFNME